MFELLKDRVFILLSLIVILGFMVFGKYNLVINYTHSLPQTLFLVDVGDKELHLGSYVAFRAYNLPNISNNHRILKIVKGIEGDRITVKNNYVWINDSKIARINYQEAYWGTISPIKNMVIPKNCYFMYGIANTSFDSRYKEFGLVCKDLIIGKAYPLF